MNRSAKAKHRRAVISTREMAGPVLGLVGAVLLCLPAGSKAVAAGPTATAEPAPVPLVSRKLSLWGLYGYDAPASAADRETVPASDGLSSAPAAASPLPQAVASNSSAAGEPESDWTFTLGLGVGAGPDYEGSEDYQPLPLWFGRAERNDNISVGIRGTKLDANLVPDSIFRAGPVLNYRFGRDDVENDQVDDLQDVDGTFEVGAFVGVELDVAGGPAVWGAGLQGLQGTGGGHSGFLATFELFYRTPLSNRWSIGLTGDSTWASEDYMEAFFGIDADDSARSGLDTYDADAGIKDVGLTADINFRIDQNWGVGLIAGYKRLLGDAADSPVVDDVGDANQFFGGLFGSYRF